MRMRDGLGCGGMLVVALASGCGDDTSGATGSTGGTTTSADASTAGDVATTTTDTTTGSGPTTSLDGDGTMTSTMSATESTSEATTMSATESTSEATTMSATESTSETTSGGQALLELDDAPALDFGAVEVGTADSRLLGVTNVGDGTATAIMASLAAPFAFTGGAYPGTGGDCGATLDPAATCQLEVELAPLDLGPLSDSLTLDYHDGVAPTFVALDLLGDATGSTDNLITNGDGESCVGTSPSGWTETGLGNWSCGAPITPYAGSNLIYANTGPTNMVYQLSQSIDVTNIAGAIDTGMTTYAFDAWARTDAAEEDYRMHVAAYDAGGGFLATMTTGWQSTPLWTSWPMGSNVPVGTRELRVRLQCFMTSGTVCNAYFDEMSLIATYP